APLGGGERAEIEAELLRELGEREDLSALEVDASVAVAQHAARAQEASGVFLGFVATLELELVRLRLDQALVADADGHEEALPFRHGERGVRDHAEQPEFGWQQLSRAAPAAFEEQLDRKPVSDQAPHVGIDHRCIQAITPERPANEEAATSPQDRAHREEVEVVARRDGVHRESLAIDAV